MDLLREAVNATVEGQGGIIFIHGEAGIGKTRLTQETGAYARLRGMRVIQGRCPAIFRPDDAPPYALWSEVIKDYLETSTKEELYRVVGFYPAEVAKLAPELRRRLPSIPQSYAIDPAQEQSRLFEAVAQFVANISRETPLLVILDDLQLTDPSSLLLLHYIVRGIQRVPLLILGVYRSENVDSKHLLTPVLGELNRERLSQSISLKRMSLEDVSEMIKHLLDQDNVPADLCKLVFDKTRGNPFFVEEVIKSLKENEVIVRDGSEWKIKEVSRIEFPESIKVVIKSRFDRLDDECRGILTSASFIGNDFTLREIQAVTGIERDRLADLIELVFRTGLIKERVVHGEAVSSFSDLLVRDVVYEEVSPFKAKELHGIVGSALEKVWSEKVDEHFGQLASHFLESGNKEKALDYFLRAGKRAHKMYAYSEAFSYFDHALKLLEEKGNDLERRTKIVEKLGDFRALMGEVDIGMEYWNKALTLWSRLENSRRRIGKLHSKMAWWFWEVRGNKTKANEHHRKALQILESEPESPELAALYEDISHMLWRTGKPTEALPWAEKALKLAERLGASDVEAWCYNDLAVLSLKSGNSEQAQRSYERGLQIALSKNLVIPAGTIYGNLCDLYFGTGELQKCFETAKEGSELTRKSGAIFTRMWIDMQLAAGYMRRGEIQKGLSLMEDILALDMRTKNTSHLPYAMWNLGQIYLLLGEWDKSTQYLIEALDYAKKGSEYQAVGDVTVALGEVFIEKGDYPEAEKYLLESGKVWEQAGDTDGQVLDLFPVLSKFYLRKGELEKANETIERTHEHATKAKKKMVVCYTDMLKGMLFREQKDWTKSIEHFEMSLSGYRLLNAQEWNVYQFAELLNEYGVMYLDRNEKGDSERADSLFEQALAIYQKMNARRRMEEILSRNIRSKEPATLDQLHNALFGKPRTETPHKVAERPQPLELDSSNIPTGNRVSTGFRELDNLLHGGIPKGYAVILSSQSCDERSLLVRKFVETGVKNGEVTFYITMDPTQFKSLIEKEHPNFHLFVCNPKADMIVGESPNVVKLNGAENLNEISIALTSELNRLPKETNDERRACIELVSDVLLQHHAIQTRRWLTALIPELKTNNFTLLAVVDPHMHTREEVEAITGLFDGEIVIHRKENESKVETSLRIARMTDQEYSKNVIRL